LFALRREKSTNITLTPSAVPWVIDERSEESGASSALPAPPFGGSGALPPQPANVRQWARSHWRLKEKITCRVRSRCRGIRSHCRRRHCRKCDKQRPRVFGWLSSGRVRLATKGKNHLRRAFALSRDSFALPPPSLPEM